MRFIGGRFSYDDKIKATLKSGTIVHLAIYKQTTNNDYCSIIDYCCPARSGAICVNASYDEVMTSGTPQVGEN